MIPLLTYNTPFPSLDDALVEPNGLLAAGGDLSLQRLITAYRTGIFPWFNEGEPILWWSPDPRIVLFPNELKVSRSLRKTLKKNPYTICFDRHFDQVIHACAAPRKGQPGTWIHPEMISAYTRLHEMGLAHSAEVLLDDVLVGGLYGVALGKVFFGESMFSNVTDASKIAFVHLVKQLEAWNYGVIDCQVKTAHLASLGAREIPRAEFSRQLNVLITDIDKGGKWEFSDSLNEKLHQ